MDDYAQGLWQGGQIQAQIDDLAARDRAAYQGQFRTSTARAKAATVYVRQTAAPKSQQVVQVPRTMALSTEMSTGTKVAIGAGLVALVGAAIYLVK